MSTQLIKEESFVRKPKDQGRTKSLSTDGCSANRIYKRSQKLVLPLANQRNAVSYSNQGVNEDQNKFMDNNSMNDPHLQDGDGTDQKHGFFPPTDNKKHDDSNQVNLGVNLFGQEGKGESSNRTLFLNSQINSSKSHKNISSKTQDIKPRKSVDGGRPKTLEPLVLEKASSKGITSQTNKAQINSIAFPASHYSNSGQESLVPKRNKTGESEGNPTSSEEKISYLEIQFERLQQEFKKLVNSNLESSRKESSDKSLNEPHEEKKACESQKRNVDLENQFEELKEKFNEKEHLSKEEIKELRTMMDDFRNGLKDVSEKQDKYNELFKIETRVAIKEKHKKFSNEPHHPEFCRAFYFLLYSLFEKSIFVSYRMEGKLPGKDKIFPKIVDASTELLSLIPKAGPILSALKGIFKIIHKEIKDGKERCKATNIRKILERYVDCYGLEEPNLLAAHISCEITQVIGKDLERLVKKNDARKTSRFQKFIQAIFHNSLDAEIEIAISAFECLLVRLYEDEAGKIQARTEEEFIIYCVEIVNNGDWHHVK